MPRIKREDLFEVEEWKNVQEAEAMEWEDENPELKEHILEKVEDVFPPLAKIQAELEPLEKSRTVSIANETKVMEKLSKMLDDACVRRANKKFEEISLSAPGVDSSTEIRLLEASPLCTELAELVKYVGIHADWSIDRISNEVLALEE